MILSLIIFMTGCQSDDINCCDPDKDQNTYTYFPPESRNDGWECADAREMGVDVGPLEEMIRRIQDRHPNYQHITSIAIVIDRQLVFEAQLKKQFDQYDQYLSNPGLDFHFLNSVTKSVVSALIGIAIDRGDIPGLDTKIHDYFKAWEPIDNWDDCKALITLKNWLTMRHGYEWDEWSTPVAPGNVNYDMAVSDDPIGFLLDLPMATEPGTTFAYATGVSYGLGRLLSIASGRTVQHFLETELFALLQITDYRFFKMDGQINTGGGLYMKTRDMAKLGQLYLDCGVWNGKRIISESWISDSVQAHVDNGLYRYGFQWWIESYRIGQHNYDAFSASGGGGQQITVIPQLNLVIVFTGNGYGKAIKLDNLIESHVLPALMKSHA